MKSEKESVIMRALNKLYGGINMSWPKVIIFAVGTAVLTAVFLCVPVFKNTSFYRMGEFYEAWIFFAVIIMSNCKKPLESALKTFVFFLISQPLIYLLQVPFASMGWGLFGYYRVWFIITLLTFPVAFAGWYITKKNWWSVLIFSPIIVSLGIIAFGTLKDAINHFPFMLLASLFCIAQIAIYIIVFFPKASQKSVGTVLLAVTVIIMLLSSARVNLNVNDFLPDNPELSNEATVSVENPDIAQVELLDPQEASVHISAHKYGETAVIISDADRELRYTLEIYDDDGVSRAKLSPAGTD